MPQTMGSIEGVMETLKKQEEYGDFKKREFVLRDSFTKNNGDVIYNHYKIQATNDAIDKLSDLKVGDTVKVSYFIRGNKWMDKTTNVPKKNKNGEEIIFVNIDAKEIEKVSGVEPAPPPDKAKEQPENLNPEGENDLPF